MLREILKIIVACFVLLQDDCHFTKNKSKLQLTMVGCVTLFLVLLSAYSCSQAVVDVSRNNTLANTRCYEHS